MSKKHKDETSEEPKQKKQSKKKEEKKEPNAAEQILDSSTSFIEDVKAEMKRVSWPNKSELIKWSIIVLVVLIFFSLFTLFVDNFIATPLLYWISGIHF